MQITVLGTPAEERQGGKINLIEAGVFDGWAFNKA
jgi:metal-dependent amidase/aminoacylase/carboxypeptidase family protein